MKTARTSTSLRVIYYYQQRILQENLRDAANITSLAKYDFMIKIWYHDNGIAAINQKKLDDDVE